MDHRLDFSQWMPKLQRILADKGLRGLSVPCTQYFRKNHKHLFGGMTILCIFTVFAPLTIISATGRRSSLPASMELPEYESWQHNFAQADEYESMTSKYGNCPVKPPRHPQHPMNPVLAASFPDGSPDLIRILIESTTGLLTGGGIATSDIVAVKTHYPYYENHANFGKAITSEDDLPAEDVAMRALLVLRDPLDSMETWMNWVLNTVHETDQGLRASRENWVKWRERHFQSEIKQWDIFLRYWLDKIPHHSRQIVVYEDLMQETTGPKELTDIVQFMRRVADIPKDTSIELQKISCLWHRITNIDDIQGGLELDDRPYTFEDLDLVAGILVRLIEDYSEQSRVVSMLLHYKENVMEKMRQLQQIDPVMITNPMGTCMVTNPRNEKMTPAYLASYPGSGSGMVRDLIEAVTGVKTGDKKGRSKGVVAIHTNFPVIHKDIHPGFLQNKDMKRAIFLIRNPLQAIYSYHNHIFWQENDLMQHSLQAPQEAWERWRDIHFLKELDKWIEQLHFWADNFERTELMILNYEWLIHDGRGPRQGTRLAMFLDGTDGEQSSAPALTVPCLWFRAVKVMNPVSTIATNPTYTAKQLEAAAVKLSGVTRDYIYDLLLGPVLKSYMEDTINQIPQDTQKFES